MPMGKRKKTLAQIEEMQYEWHTPEAKRLLKEMGISERNWKIFSRHIGKADGRAWTFGMLADKESISRPRAYQIFKKTQGILAKYISRLDDDEE